ncbi:hypothetical protein BDZ97DRAFT_1155887 [Flammula alnicola]|nr:hypothetical protein BDZ97DRAFT_1155887 [Flammula alnicola]
MISNTERMREEHWPWPKFQTRLTERGRSWPVDSLEKMITRLPSKRQRIARLWSRPFRQPMTTQCVMQKTLRGPRNTSRMSRKFVRSHRSITIGAAILTPGLSDPFGLCIPGLPATCNVMAFHPARFPLSARISCLQARRGPQNRPRTRIWRD